jgi:nitrate reductase gamma subunit
VQVQHVTVARLANCDTTVNAMPGSVVPFGVASTLLLVFALGAAILAYRRLPETEVGLRSTATALFIGVIGCGVLFTAYLGIYAVIVDGPNRPYCFG